MSSNQEHNIFDPGRELTRPEIEAYLAGNLSPEEMNEVERIAASSPMSQDALDGMRMAGNSTALDDISKSIYTKTSFLSSTAFRLSALIVVAVAIGFVVFMSNQAEQEAVADNEVPKPAETELILDEEPLAVEDQQEEVQMQVVQTESTDSSISLVVDIRDQQEQLPTQEHYVVDHVISEEKLATIEIQEVPLEEDEPDEDPILHVPGQPIYHVVDYRLVDYRGIREEPFNVLSRDLTGVPASHSDEYDVREDDMKVISQVAYVDYLKEAIVAFSESRFKAARNKFKTILKKYPEDANALFYGGLTAYELGKYGEAVRMFEKCLENDIRTFHQESAYYMANSYWRDGKKDLARPILETIVEEGKFYAEKAGLMLERL
jgi:TolA-binding protein